LHSHPDKPALGKLEYAAVKAIFEDQVEPEQRRDPENRAEKGSEHAGVPEITPCIAEGLRKQSDNGH